MRKLTLLGSVVLLCVVPGVSAQGTPGAAGGDGPAVRINNEVTVTGCVMRESQYQVMRDGGGMPDSGPGSLEYILAKATPSRVDGAGGRRGGRGDLISGRPVEDSGRVRPATRNYTLSGTLERGLAAELGRLVQIVGTASAPPNMAPDGPVENLPHIEIAAVNPTGEACP